MITTDLTNLNLLRQTSCVIGTNLIFRYVDETRQLSVDNDINNRPSVGSADSDPRKL